METRGENQGAAPGHPDHTGGTVHTETGTSGGTQQHNINSNSAEFTLRNQLH